METKAPTKVIKIPYTPRNWALELHSSLKRFIVLVIHRRGGKTTAAINHLNRDALKKPNTKYAYVAPTYKQAKRIVWLMIKKYTRNIPGIKFNESELLITYPNGSIIMVVGADNPDSLRGIGLDGAFLDEYPQQSPVIFTEILTKCVADTLGYIIFGGTPKGKGHFFAVHNVAKTDPNWLLIYRNIDDSLKREHGKVIDNLRRALEDDRALVKQGLMTQDEFEQEWFNSFEAAIRGAVYLKEMAKARSDGRIGMVPHDPKYPVYTVWDLGVGMRNAMAIGFFQHIGGTPRMIDYYETYGEGLPHFIKILKEKPYVYAKHFAPHDIRQKEFSTGKTRIDTAKGLGIEFQVIPSVSLENGIDQARLFWATAAINSKPCEIFLDLIGSYRYDIDPVTRLPSKEPKHDHTSHAGDVWRYAALVEDQMKTEEVMQDTTDSGAAEVLWGKDEYRGDVDPENDGKHPLFKGVDIGKMGHEKK